MNIPILYEDGDVLVLDKPAGLLVHADGKHDEPTLVDWLLARYPDIAGVGDAPDASRSPLHDSRPPRPGIVHRLDKETSGAMVIAKNQEAFLHLKRQFQNRAVRKVYHAFVWGEMKQERGTIDRPIGRSPSGHRWSATRGARGTMRDAVTWYKVRGKHDGFSFVEAQPKTGRTHQIRVHFVAINHPVVGDKLYAPARVSHAGGPKKPPALGFARTALHARSIEFSGRGGKKIRVEAPYPEDFLKAVRFFGAEPREV